MVKYKVNALFITGLKGNKFTKDQVIQAGSLEPGAAGRLLKNNAIELVPETVNVSVGFSLPVAPISKGVIPISSFEDSEVKTDEDLRAEAVKKETEKLREKKPVADFKPQVPVTTPKTETKPEIPFKPVERGSKTFTSKTGEVKIIEKESDITKAELIFVLSGIDTNFDKTARKAVLYNRWMEL